MNVFLAVLIILGAAGLAVGCLLLVRRRAPDGGYFHDGDRAAGVFGVLATGFAVLLGFVVFLAFANYETSRSGAESEALILAQQFETAQFLPLESRQEISGEIVCYGRLVVHGEWSQMEAGGDGDTLNPWAVELFHTLNAIEPTNASEEAAFSKWLDQTSEREDARNDRLHGAEGVIPSPLWYALILMAAVIFVFMLFFADSGERAIVQALQIGSVIGVMVATLLVIGFLNAPFHNDVGGLQPVAMERTLRILDEAEGIVGLTEDDAPCDEEGNPLESEAAP